MMSVRDIPVRVGVGPMAGGLWKGCAVASNEGSMGANAGVVLCCRESVRKLGSSTPEKGLRRGEWAGVAMGVWSGVGDRESCEKVGDEGAVELGELGRDLLIFRRAPV